MKSIVNPEHSKNLDQFYTHPDYAAYFFNTISTLVDLNNSILLEPSAGTGSFFNLMREPRIGFDLEPKSTGITKQDFLKWIPLFENSIITIGNPPFGKNASTAIQFFNHATKFSKVIAFILPKTFRKDSVINRLDPFFHLVFDEDVPHNSFIFNSLPYDVWCCSQIWIKKDVKRNNNICLKKDSFVNWFTFVKPEYADFSIQRVGVNAGVIRTSNFLDRSPSSHFFVKQHFNWVLSVFELLNFDSVKFNTVGNPSISLSELLQLWQSKAIEVGKLVSK